MDRLARFPIPYDCGFTLIGDADCGDLVGVRAGLGDRLDSYRNLRGEDLVGIVLNPSRLGKDLGKFALGDGADCSLMIKKKGA